MMASFITPPNSATNSNERFQMTTSTKEKLEESIKVLGSYFNQHSLKVDGGERKKMSEDLAFLFNDDNSVSYAVSI